MYIKNLLIYSVIILGIFFSMFVLCFFVDLIFIIPRDLDKLINQISPNCKGKVYQCLNIEMTGKSMIDVHNFMRKSRSFFITSALKDIEYYSYKKGFLSKACILKGDYFAIYYNKENKVIGIDKGSLAFLPIPFVPILAKDCVYKHDYNDIFLYSLDCNIKEVKKFINKSININEKTSYDMTILHFASSAGCASIVRELIEAGADINEKTKGGWTPLHNAAANGDKDTICELLKAGTKINERNNFGSSALDIAIEKRNNQAAEILVEFMIKNVSSKCELK